MRTCDLCRYWSEMIARAGGGTTNPFGTTEAMCLAPGGPRFGKYMTANGACTSFAKNTAGRVDWPGPEGDEARAEYARQAEMRYENGKPVFAPDGTMLDENGNRSIFDDVDDAF